MTLRLDPAQHQRVTDCADVLNMPANQLIVDAIDKKLSEFKHEYKPTGSNGMRYCAKCRQTEADPNLPCLAAS